MCFGQSQYKGNHKGGRPKAAPFVEAAEGRLLCVGSEHWAYLTVETQDLVLVESQDICLVETQDTCCVESLDMCFVQSQYLTSILTSILHDSSVELSRDVFFIC